MKKLIVLVFALVLPLVAFADKSATINTGSGFSITVISDGTAPFTYQWFKNGVAIPGATGNAFVIAAAQASDAATYTCTVTNPVGSATSDNALITVATPVVAPVKVTVGIIVKPSTP